MNIVIIYATNSGGTLLVSREIESVLKNHQNSVTLKNVAQISPDELTEYDVVFLGSPSWDYQGKQGQVQEQFLAFIDRMKGKTFSGKKFAIFGLGDTSYTYFAGAVDGLLAFVKVLGGILIGEPLRIDGFYFDQEKNTQKVHSWAEGIAKEMESPSSN